MVLKARDPNPSLPTFLMPTVPVRYLWPVGAAPSTIENPRRTWGPPDVAPVIKHRGEQSGPPHVTTRMWGPIVPLPLTTTMWGAPEPPPKATRTWGPPSFSTFVKHSSQPAGSSARYVVEAVTTSSSAVQPRPYATHGTSVTPAESQRILTALGQDDRLMGLLRSAVPPIRIR